jgi:pimeloyl-ACP methyl ester carboxylesterase
VDARPRHLEAGPVRWIDGRHGLGHRGGTPEACARRPVALSAEQYLEGTDVGMSAAKLSCPTLFVTADNDPYGSDSADGGFQKLAPKGVSTLTVVPGTDHGIQLLTHADVMQQVTAFLKTQLG